MGMVVESAILCSESNYELVKKVWEERGIIAISFKVTPCISVFLILTGAPKNNDRSIMPLSSQTPIL
jgi:hypothetical protein